MLPPRCAQHLTITSTTSYAPLPLADGIVVGNADVGISSARSLSLHTGTLLLEQQILQAQADSGGSRTNKRRKKREDQSQSEERKSELTEGWRQLGKLYKTMGEEDILMGLSEQHLSKVCYH